MSDETSDQVTKRLELRNTLLRQNQEQALEDLKRAFNEAPHPDDQSRVVDSADPRPNYTLIIQYRETETKMIEHIVNVEGNDDPWVVSMRLHVRSRTDAPALGHSR